jgi:hypothetical protein
MHRKLVMCVKPAAILVSPEPVPTVPKTAGCRPLYKIVFVAPQKEEIICSVEVIILPELVCI